MAPIDTPEPAHLVTDASGEIQTISRRARALLRGRGAERGRNLLACFAEHQKALLFDMDIARAGWPTERTLAASPEAVVRYRVSRLLPGGGLYWEFRVLETQRQRCA